MKGVKRNDMRSFIQSGNSLAFMPSEKTLLSSRYHRLKMQIGAFQHKSPIVRGQDQKQSE